jgi:hypothetical protein
MTNVFLAAVPRHTGVRVFPAALVVILISSLAALGAGPPADDAAREPAPLPREVQLVRRAVAGMERLEAVEMLTAILRGSKMGPGGGWFHPAQSRYSPLWLAAHFDTNHDLRLTRDEFTGPRTLFDRLDRDQDGVVTASDFDWSDQSAFLREANLSGRFFYTLDTSSNGKITRQELDAFFDRIAGGREYLTPEDIKRALFPPSPAASGKGPPPDAPTKLTLLKGLLSGELGSLFEGPQVDQPAPPFTLQVQDGKRRISLADYRGKTPVVLVFGSFT